MAYLVLAYPKISKDDYFWIQNIRKIHDVRYFNVVEPHFTLVFATNKLSVKEFTTHVQNVVNNISAFDILLNSTQIVEDDSQTFYHGFLVPTVGYDEVNQLHDQLYAGPLSSELRHDIPFIPHVGIGTNNSEQEINTVLGNINAQNKAITGFIDEVTVVEYDGKKVVNVLTIPLKTEDM